MPPKIEYRLICTETAISMSERISAYLSDGWSLYGSPFSRPGYPNDSYIYQAVIRPIPEPITK